MCQYIFLINIYLVGDQSYMLNFHFNDILPVFHLTENNCLKIELRKKFHQNFTRFNKITFRLTSRDHSMYADYYEYILSKKNQLTIRLLELDGIMAFHFSMKALQASTVSFFSSFSTYTIASSYEQTKSLIKFASNMNKKYSPSPRWCSQLVFWHGSAFKINWEVTKTKKRKKNAFNKKKMNTFLDQLEGRKAKCDNSNSSVFKKLPAKVC